MKLITSGDVLNRNFSMLSGASMSTLQRVNPKLTKDNYKHYCTQVLCTIGAFDLKELLIVIIKCPSAIVTSDNEMFGSVKKQNP